MRHPFSRWIAAGCIGLLGLAWGCASPVQGTGDEAKESSHDRMLALLKTIRERTPDENPLIGDALARSLRSQYAILPKDQLNLEIWQVEAKLGLAELLLGNEELGIEHMLRAYKRLPEMKRLGLGDSTVNQLTLNLGMGYLRLGETQNCCLRHSPDSCVLPVRGGGVHTKQEGSRQAIVYFTEVLQSAPRDSTMYLEALWLMNIAYMTLDAYPDQVPAEWRIPAEVLQSEHDFPRFLNIASKMGMDTFHLAGGSIADDFDGDGDLDLVVSTMDTSGSMRFWINRGDGGFSDETDRAGLGGLYGGLNMVQADYDNDSDIDILVLRGAWFAEGGRHPQSLLRNNGDGTFTDVTFDAGLAEVHYPSQTGSWGDYDNDGDLDLYKGNEHRGGLTAPCELFRNNGDGTFTDVAEAAGVTNLRFTKAVIFGDYDSDRLPDLYVSNLGAPNRLYRNNGNGTFTDVAPELDVTLPLVSFPAWFFDIENDGDLDIWVSSYVSGSAEVAASYLGLPVADGVLMKLYRNDGAGGFQDVAREWNLIRATAPMGSNFGDLDNDGWIDFYLGTGNPDIKSLMPNLMYRNNEGKGFADVTFAGGFGHLQKGHGVAFADLDNDGDQDVFEAMGGAYFVDRYRDAFYENPGFGNHWIGVQLAGVTSNRSAIGARIRVDVIERGSPRSIFKWVSSGGTFGANPLRQHIGLGKAAKIERLEIFWPTSGKTQVVASAPIDSIIRIVEDQPGFTTVSSKKFELNGGVPASR